MGLKKKLKFTIIFGIIIITQIKYIMLNDKEKFKEVFELENASELMFKISENFNDKDSINSLYKLLVN